MIMTFDDEFNTFVSSPNGQIGWKTQYNHGRNQPANYEAEYYSDASVGVNPFSISHNVLTITAAPVHPPIVYDWQTKTYTSGVITTQGSFTQLYGYFEMRADLPEGKGFWPAFWMLPADNTWPPELDVFEQLGNEPDKLHYGMRLTKTSGIGFSSTIPGVSKGFHTYGIDWEPDTIKWFVDGKQVWQTANHINKPMYMIANLAVGDVGSWPGPTDGVSSAELKIDYIRAYASPHTPSPKPAQVQVSGDGVTGTVNLANVDKGAGVNYAAGSGNKTINTSSHNDYVDLGSGFDKVHLGGGNDTVKFGSGVSQVFAGPGHDTFIFDKTVALKPNDTILNFKATDGSELHDTFMFQNFGSSAHLNFHGYANEAHSTQVYDVVSGSGHVDATFTVNVQLNHDGTYHQLGSGDVTVTDNNAPIITSNGGSNTAVVSIAENTTAVTTVTATDPDVGHTDPDVGQTLSYSISGGADANKFQIASSTGALSFVTAPNFEAPTDVGGNNVYDVTVQVSDGHGGIDTQAIAVTVTDVVEPVHQIIGGPGNDVLRGTSENDHFFGGEGVDSVIYAGFRGQYVVSFDGQAGSGTVSGPDGFDLFSNVENFQFADGRVVTDIHDPAAIAYRMYDSAFDRAPDSMGLNVWIAALQNGLGVEGMASAFVSSPEFSQKYGTLNNQQFVEQLYHNVLGREGETSGVAAWMNALNGGMSRGQVLAGFSESNEHIQLTAPAIAMGIWDVNETAASIARLYDSAFNRLPDANGLLSWKSAVDKGMTLATVADGFVGSTEFQSTYGSLTNQQFVELLYHNVLDRPGEAAGVSAWTNALNSGAYDRGDVLLGFSESFEHQVKSVSLIDHGVLVI